MDALLSLWNLFIVICFGNRLICSVASERLLSITDFMNGSFSYKRFNGSWISDTEILYQSDINKDIIKLDVETQKITVFLNYSILLQYNISHFQVNSISISSDKQWMAVPIEKRNVYRHSSLAKYVIHEFKTGFHYLLAGGNYIQLLQWSPVGHALVYVMDNDIYYQHKPGQYAADRITNTGLTDVVYNGITDWVYEEEVFSDTKALWFSPEGTKLAFITFDDSSVHEVSIPQYGKPGFKESQYEKEITIRYPKAGSTNPTVSLNVVDLRSKRRMKIINLPAPIKDVTEDHIIGMVKWVDDSYVAATWSPRVQNAAIMLVCNASNAECLKVLERKESKGWIDWPEPLFKNTKHFLTVLTQPQDDDNDKYHHLTMVSPDGEKILTNGKWEVTELNGWDQNNYVVYFTATLENNPGRTHIYSIKDDGSESPKCLSCDKCGSASAMFSKEYSYLVILCNGPEFPEYSVYKLSGEFVMKFGDNNRLKELMSDLLMPEILDLYVPVRDNFTARVRLLLPNKLAADKNINEKYPLLLSVYGGPDSKKIDDHFLEPSWDVYLATRMNIIIAYVDGRGSKNRGDNLKFAVYRKLGGPEVDDFISVAEYLQINYDFIDRSRIAIWGWSYGGYATAMTLAKDNRNVFKCGISVAPVTSWIYYDSIYTERYMGLPTSEDNMVGYNKSDVTLQVGNFRNKMFYLIHGNADDNVHYQQSMMLSKALEENDILFDQQSYPDEAHGLGHVRLHLYHSMERFWSECLNVIAV